MSDVELVTFAWADPAAELYGHVRLSSAGGVAVAFAAGERVLTTEDVASESPFAVRGAELVLEFEATTPVAALAGRNPVTKAAGVGGTTQLCRVRGTVAGRPVRGLGQRDELSGRVDWDKLALTRRVAAWLDERSGVAIFSVRPAGAASHADEASWAVALDAERVRKIDDPRLSTTTDATGRPIRAGLELSIDSSDEYPLRGTGEQVAVAELELGPLRLQCAFFRWHVDGRTVAGRYDLLRRA